MEVGTLKRFLIMIFLIIGISVFSMAPINQENYISILDNLLGHDGASNISIFDALYITSVHFAGEEVMAIYLSDDSQYWNLITAGHSFIISASTGEVIEVSENELLGFSATVSVSDALTTAYLQNRRVPIAGYLKVNEGTVSWNVITPGFILEIDSVVPSVISNLPLSEELSRMKTDLEKGNNREKNMDSGVNSEDPYSHNSGGNEGKNENGNKNDNSENNTGNGNKNDDKENDKKR